MTDTGQVPGEGLPENAGMVEQPGVPSPGAYTFLDPSDSPAEDDDLLLMPGAQGAWSEAQSAQQQGHTPVPGHVQAPGHAQVPGHAQAPGPAQAPGHGRPSAHGDTAGHGAPAMARPQAVHQPGPHETAGRDSGSVDLNGVRMPGSPPASSHPGPARRPLHRGPSGPAVPDGAGSPVRSLADRGPAGATPPQHAVPVRHAGPPTVGPEYLDIPRDDAGLPGPQLGEIPPQGASPWTAQPSVRSQQAGAQGAYAAPAETVVPGDTEAPEASETAGATGVPGVPDDTSAPQATGAPEAFAPEGPMVPEQALPEHVLPEQGQYAAQGAEFAQGTPAHGTPVHATPPHGAPAHGNPAPGAVLPGMPEPAAFPQAAGATDLGEAQAAPGDLGAPGMPGEPPVAEPSQFPSAEQPVFAQAVPAAAGVQTPFAVASAQPWDAVPVPHADASGPQSGFVPDAAHAVPAGIGAVGGQRMPVGDAGHPAEARHAAQGPSGPGPEDAPAPMPTALPGEHGGHGAHQVPTPIGEFVPVDGMVPTTPHLAPTPPHPLVVPQEDPAVEPAPEGESAVDAEQAPAQSQPLPVEAGAAPVAVPPAAESAEAAAQAEAPVADAQQPPATVPAPREGDLGVAAPITEGPDAAGEPQPVAPESETAGDAVGIVEAVPVLPVAPAEFPAAPETADLAEDLDEADEVISFEPIDANEVTEVAEAPEMAVAPAVPEAPAAPETPEAPEAPDAFAAAAAPEAPEALAAQEATEIAEAPDAPEALVAMEAPEAAGTPEAPVAPDEPEVFEVFAAPQGPELLGAEEPVDGPVGGPVDESAEAVEPVESADPAAEPAAPVGAPAPAYEDAEREAVLRVMRERRDIRNGFRSDAIPHEVLLRVLEAAHTAPSVGHSQPWDFVVIKSAETRRTMHELAMRQRDAYAKSLPKGRAKQFKELKIEAILDTPVNIVVTADPTRGGRHTLGRHTQPQMAPYSSALAVENLWLAARAEGLGVGWVSFFDEREMVRALGLPEHLEVVAYLCVGYVDEFPDEPELMQAGWSKRRPLSWVVHEETYGRRALPGEDPHDLLAETVSNIRPLDAKALGEAWERQKRMTKPPGALGMLEIISAQLSGLSRMCPPPIPEPAAVAIFAGDHGVHAQGVTAWPQEVTAQMVANFLGGGAVCNAFANQVGAEVCVIDVGVASELPATPGLLPRKVRAGTADMTTGPALTREEVKAAIEVGIETARDLVAAGNKALLTGEMGIANTTASAALISVYTDTDPSEVTGRGTGINDEMHTRKVEVVRRALDLHQPDPADPIGVLSAIGGLEHAAMVGLLLGGASLRTPVILDGVSAGAAALVARAIAPEVLAACIAGHRSAEPGHVAALNKLGLRPLVDLDLRLGEGTGALLALPVVQSAARAMHEVATFDSAGVTEK
ncbi:nicotinate-nucleotide--dimethylbenzimidazole phosphoribosyltransferase [Streptomyces sp. NPDC087300]|uniref:nicotinate-nucleotide--dimethylbenzimidazole phosphoribosyltransferase n=1 Tax=Streptomyces sp. NPDC087300 TaxID=3365780 RepID=UPI0038084F23